MNSASRPAASPSASRNASGRSAPAPKVTVYSTASSSGVYQTPNPSCVAGAKA